MPRKLTRGNANVQYSVSVLIAKFCYSLVISVTISHYLQWLPQKVQMGGQM